MERSRRTRDGTAEPVSRDQILRHERGQGNIHFPYSADHEQDWQPYPVDPYSCYMCDHTYIHTVDGKSAERDDTTTRQGCRTQKIPHVKGTVPGKFHTSRGIRKAKTNVDTVCYLNNYIAAQSRAYFRPSLKKHSHSFLLPRNLLRTRT